MISSISGFNGERLDPVTGMTHLGNGYRPYNPTLMHFTCPDSMSPFGAGGINPYAYCVGDPVNQADPSGHFSLSQAISMALGFVAGIVLGIVTDGMAMPALLALMATVAGETVIGAGTELATEANDGQRINWIQVGISAGLGAATALAGYGVVAGGRGLARRINPMFKTGEESVHSWGNNNIHHVLAFGYRDSWRENDIYMAFAFKDYKSLRIKPRLTIVAHGGYNPELSTGEIFLENTQRAYHGEELASEMRNMGYNFNNYSSVRLVVCNSGDGGATSFASRFSREAGLPVTGFEGTVETRDSLTKVTQTVFHNSRALGMSEIDSFRNVNGYVNSSIDKFRWQVNLQQLDSPVFRVMKQVHSYHPVTWFPDGTYSNINY